MDESHHCNVLQLLLKSEGWMNFKTDTSHMYKCQVSILNSRFISQQTFNHSTVSYLVSISAYRSGSRKRTGQLHELYCSRYKLVSFLFGQCSWIVSDRSSFWDGKRRHELTLRLSYSIIFFLYWLSRSTPWNVRRGASRSLKKFGNNKVIVILLMILVLLTGLGRPAKLIIDS